MENLKVIITLANNKKYTLEEFLKKKITFSIADPVNAEVVRNFNAGVRTEEKNNKNAKAREIEIKKEKVADELLKVLAEEQQLKAE